MRGGYLYVLYLHLVSVLVQLFHHLTLSDALVLTDVDENLDAGVHHFGFDHEARPG